jgi:chorismate synthase
VAPLQPADITVRDLVHLADCRTVVDVQHDVWGRDSETVPASLLMASIRRGGILIGAFEGDALVGFVWSMPGRRDGQTTHWSHMTGVRSGARGHGVGERLKWAQRDRALADGIELIEWTFDPLQAANAYFNLACLGAVAADYRINAYGEMPGPLHRGTPTDRLIAEWWIGRPHVERRKAVRQRTEGVAAPIVPRSADVLDAPAAIEVAETEGWPACRTVHPDLDARRILLAVPPAYTAMQQQAIEVALAWRLGVRAAFGAYFARGYRAVDFFLDRDTGGGAYLLSRDDAATREPRV